MGRRSRSRSPKRDRRRSRSRDRERRREHRRSRSRSPRRRRSRSPRRRSPERRHDRDRRDRSRDRRTSPEPQKKKKNPPNSGQLYKRPTIDASAFIGKSEEEIQMMTLMGFGDFDTTKGKHVPGNDVGECNIQEKRRYRQYMNRRGGFNRPLDPIA